jgi:hypothetical protein
MPNYEDARIYKLVSKDVSHDLIYIGSTTRDLRERLGEHKRNYKKWGNGKYSYVTSFELFKNGEVDIILIEEVNCENKHQLHSRERYWIENLNCVNKQIPCQTLKEYRDNNKEKIKERMREYKEKNKDKIREYMREYQKKKRANKKSSLAQPIDC